MPRLAREAVPDDKGIQGLPEKVKGRCAGAVGVCSAQSCQVKQNTSTPRAHRSILVAVVFHITAGCFNELFETHPDSEVIQTGYLLLLLAIGIVVTDRDFSGAWNIGITRRNAGRCKVCPGSLANCPDWHWIAFICLGAR